MRLVVSESSLLRASYYPQRLFWLHCLDMIHVTIWTSQFYGNVPRIVAHAQTVDTQATFHFPCGIGVSRKVAWKHSKYTYVQLCEVVVCVSSNTDQCDAIYLDLFSKLLYLRGLGKKTILIKHFNACVITTSLFMVMIALFPGLCRLQYLIASHVTGKGQEVLSCTVMSCYTW